MKKFEDLEFQPHDFIIGLHAVLMFPNRHGVSVVKQDENKYEVAVLKGNNKDYVLWYDNDITDGIVKNLKESQVTEIMEKVQKLRKSR